jgi:hypothetical protein
MKMLIGRLFPRPRPRPTPEQRIAAWHAREMRDRFTRRGWPR